MKKHTLIILLGLILMIVPFFINSYEFYRLVLLGIGILIATLALVFKKKRNIFVILIVPILLIVLSYGVDTMLFYKFKRVPLFVYEIKSSDTISIYNSFFYRIYNCNKDLKLDYGYTKEFLCNPNELDIINVNEFLQNPHDTIKEYKNKFIRLHGKISKLSGSEKIELASFLEPKNTLNGYVNFNLNYVVEVNINEDLSKYRIYDFIDVIGEVSSLKEEDGKYIISLINTKLIYEGYDKYKFEIVETSTKNLKHLVNDYYLYKLNALNVLYENKEIYELSYLITDNKMNWQTLTNNSQVQALKDKEEKEIGKMYMTKDFNLAECNNGKKIITTKNNKITEKICNLDVEK